MGCKKRQKTPESRRRPAGDPPRRPRKPQHNQSKTPCRHGLFRSYQKLSPGASLDPASASWLRIPFSYEKWPAGWPGRHPGFRLLLLLRAKPLGIANRTVSQSVSQLFTQKLCFTIEKQSNSILKSELAKALQVYAGMVFSDPIKNGLLEPL